MPGRRVGYSWMEAGRSGRVLPVRVVLRLHQAIGNREVARILGPPPRTTAPAAPPSESARGDGFAAKSRRLFRRFTGRGGST